jgi:hypothetical protein
MDGMMMMMMISAAVRPSVQGLQASLGTWDLSGRSIFFY